ncbi:MAG: Biopolymer transport protein ExbD/TolR [Phycisphaerales bacterium]|nr:Biopolymer transport protein ExbD/TolR [Phycisphaerales bacterium]
MTPLVDVVMVILIFLMLAGSFGGATHFLVARTAGNFSVAPASRKAGDFVLDIGLRPTNDGGFVATAGKITTSDSDVLSKELAVQLAAFHNAGTEPGQIQVVIHPARNVKYKNVIAVYQAAMRAKYEKIAFATTK